MCWLLTALKVLIRALFPIEELHHAHAADMLLRVGVDAGDGGAHAAVGLAHMLAEHARDQQDEGQDGERQSAPATSSCVA